MYLSDIFLNPVREKRRSQRQKPREKGRSKFRNALRKQPGGTYKKITSTKKTFTRTKTRRKVARKSSRRGGSGSSGIDKVNAASEVVNGIVGMFVIVSIML